MNLFWAEGILKKPFKLPEQVLCFWITMPWWNPSEYIQIMHIPKSTCKGSFPGWRLCPLRVVYTALLVRFQNRLQKCILQLAHKSTLHLTASFNTTIFPKPVFCITLSFTDIWLSKKSCLWAPWKMTKTRSLGSLSYLSSTDHVPKASCSWQKAFCTSLSCAAKDSTGTLCLLFLAWAKITTSQ